MKHKFKRLLSAVSALAVTVAAMPITGLSAIAEDETAETSIEDIDVLSPEEISTESSKADTSLVLSNLGEPMVMAAQTGITKEEWIHDLVSIFDMSIEDDSTMEYYFTDIDNSDYAYEINLAANYGVFDIESDLFDPDDYVTREFAAHTANYCMSYLDNGTTVTFKDSDDIYYEYDAVVAVQRGWFTLSSGKFQPDALMTKAESEAILNDAKASVESVAIDENADSTVNYEKSVIQLGDSVSASYFNGNVIISGTPPALKAGNVFSVKIDGVDRLYKVISVTKDDNGNTVVAVTDAALKDAVSSIDIQGYGDVDYDNVMFYGTSSISNSAKLIQYKSNIPNINGMQSQLVKSVDITGDTISISEDIDMGGASIALSGTIKNIKPEYKLDYDGLSVKSFYLNVDADADFTCKLTGKLVNETSSKEINLAKVPVYCGGPMSADIVISVSVSVTGEITMKYSWDCNGGVSYSKDDGWRVTKNFQKKGFTITASGSEKIAVKGKLSAEVFGYEIGNVYVMGGEKGTFTNTPQKDGAIFCDNLKVYAFAEFGASLNLFNLVTFSQSYEFINYNNSPLRYNKHWENGVEVEKCSFDESVTSTTASRTTSKPKYYSSYSSYGLEFDGVITSANSADSGETTAYQTWTEDTKLTQNTTVNGDLYLESDINLDGKILTINGNLYHKSGTITVNNGTLNVSGNYTMQNATVNNVGETEYNDCYADLNMRNEHDKVNISGNFTTHKLKTSSSYYVHIYQGTFSVAGDVWSDGGIDYSSSYVSRFVLNGTGTQKYYNNGSVNEFEVTNPDKRTIICSGKLSVNKFVSDTVMESDDTNLYAIDLNQHKVTINGDVKMTYNQTINLNGGVLTINGDLMQKTGTISCNNGTLNINGNYTMQDATVNNVGETEYNDCYADLNMRNEHDKVNISGNFTTHKLKTSSSYYVHIYQGTFSVAGDVWSDGGIDYSSSYVSRFVLNGTGTQKYYNNGSVNEFEVTNPDKRTIICSGKLSVNKFVSDTVMESDDTNLYAIDLNQHKVTINGDVKMTYNQTINLNGGVLTINGDLMQKTGTISCNNGTLNINGNYTMQDATVNNVGETEYNNCAADLNMQNEHDKVNISGDFITHNLSSSNNSVILHQGVFSVAGNIWSDGGISTSRSYGHRTILTGNKKQSVKLGSSNKFNILVLTKPITNYTFDPENCWNTLITVEASSGDANGDGEFTVADVVLLQKWLLAVPNTNLPCWQAVDMYDDDKLDVFDLCLLKRKLING